MVEAHLKAIELFLESFEGTYPISSDISYLSLGVMISDNPVLHQSNNTEKDKRNDEDMYFTVGEVKAKSSLSLSPDKLIRIWDIG